MPKTSIRYTFAIEWGIFAYKVMPFGLTNAPATFQRLTSHAFKEYLQGILRNIYGRSLHTFETADRACEPFATDL